MQNPLVRTAFITLGSFLLVIGVVTAWTGPGGNPPENNTPAPVTVGNADQIKAGGLELGSLVVRGSGIVRGNLAVQQNLTVTGSGTSRPTVDADAGNTLVTKDYLLSKVGGGGGDNLGNHTATLDLNVTNHKIVNLLAPTNPLDGANKAYVDAQVGTRALTTNLTGTIKSCRVSKVSDNAGLCVRTITASCNSGEVAISGGAYAVSTNGGATGISGIQGSYPSSDSLSGWTSTVYRVPAPMTGCFTALVEHYAICCRVNP